VIKLDYNQIKQDEGRIWKMKKNLIIVVMAVMLCFVNTASSEDFGIGPFDEIQAIAMSSGYPTEGYYAYKTKTHLLAVSEDGHITIAKLTKKGDWDFSVNYSKTGRDYYLAKFADGKPKIMLLEWDTAWKLAYEQLGAMKSARR
jgi:hypothetical protein